MEVNNEPKLKTEKEIESTAERLAEIFIAQIDFSKKTNEKYHGKRNRRK